MSSPSPNPADGSTSGVDDRVLLEVVDRIAMLFTDAGMPPMAARVFGYILAEDRDSYTSRDLAEGLHVSPAAISGAVRVLVGAGLVTKGRRPGSRSDHYTIDDRDLWSTIMHQRLAMLRRWEELMAETVHTLGHDSPGGRRLLETQAYFRFIHTEQTALQERWNQRKDELIAEIADEHDG